MMLYQGNRWQNPWLCVVITIESRTQVNLVLGRVRFEVGYERKGRVRLGGWKVGKSKYVGFEWSPTSTLSGRLKDAGQRPGDKQVTGSTWFISPRSVMRNFAASFSSL
uniref:Uncharacterized protein n=1 Tax=Fusarium oxysporum (strain Fo5176) TaxID=660025 RepID=A0A0D2XL10_FUSOF